jgi:hypothetical protein
MNHENLSKMKPTTLRKPLLARKLGAARMRRQLAVAARTHNAAAH